MTSGAPSGAPRAQSVRLIAMLPHTQEVVPSVVVDLCCKAYILTGSSVIWELLGKPRCSSVFLICKPAFRKMSRNVVSCL